MRNRRISPNPHVRANVGGSQSSDETPRLQPLRVQVPQGWEGYTTTEQETPQEEEKTKKKSSLHEIIETLLLAVLIFVLVRSVVLNYRVDGSSMEPTLHNGEMLIVNRRAYSNFEIGSWVNWLPGVSIPDGESWYPFDPPRRGDIIVFDPPGNSSEPYIKRVLGLPGERISIHDGSVYVNGQRLDEPYLDSQTSWRGIRTDEYFVQPGYVFVLGDNRNNSSDSRVFGAVPVTDIIGKAWVAFWPPSEAQLFPRPAYAID